MKSKNSPSTSEIKTKTKAPRLRVGLKGVGHDEFAAEPRMYTNINSTSPLRHDWPMLDGAMRMAKRVRGGGGSARDASRLVA